jgi:hypothetical protein
MKHLLLIRRNSYKTNKGISGNLVISLYKSRAPQIHPLHYDIHGGDNDPHLSCILL